MSVLKTQEKIEDDEVVENNAPGVTVKEARPHFPMLIDPLIIKYTYNVLKNVLKKPVMLFGCIRLEQWNKNYFSSVYSS